MIGSYCSSARSGLTALLTPSSFSLHISLTLFPDFILPPHSLPSPSAGAAIYNNEYAITQVSYASTSEGLSDKDLYEFFTRTCGSDSAQGPALAKTLQSLGIVPFIAVVHTDDDYSVSLSNSFSTRFVACSSPSLISPPPPLSSSSFPPAPDCSLLSVMKVLME
jgi:hypothetical protein